jgi:hypothetical protein
MNLGKSEMQNHITMWLQAWNNHNLDGVMDLIHDDVVFENWTGVVIRGKKFLYRSWFPWFLHHGNFIFTLEDIFVDELEQKALFSWRLEWPSLEKIYKGKPESRRGVDVLHFLDGKIHQKYSYSKTTILIENSPVVLSAGN